MQEDQREMEAKADTGEEYIISYKELKTFIPISVYQYKQQ